MTGSPFKDEHQEILESIRTGAGKLFLTCHREAFQFFATGVRKTRQALGSEYFDAASKYDLQIIWERLYDRADYRVTKAMLGATFAVIDLEDIIDAPQDNKRIAIRAVLRFMFVEAAQAICEHCPKDVIATSQQQQRSWYTAWELLAQRPVVQEVWKLEKLPVRSPYDHGRSHEPRIIRDAWADLSEDEWALLNDPDRYL